MDQLLGHIRFLVSAVALITLITGVASSMPRGAEATIGSPPDCSEAVPSPDSIWPPNHKFVDVSVEGITDPDGDPITITITSIFQDEPVDSDGDGSSTPDASGVGTDLASVRAERVGSKNAPGDGRVYHIGFTADDGQGNTCEASVTVAVPHDQGQGETSVDQGPLFDSTIP